LKNNKSAFVYIIINILIKTSSFLLTILYWQYLSTFDFGLLSLGIVFNELILAFFILGIDSTILRHYKEWSLTEKKSKVGFFWTISIINTIIITLILLIFYKYFTIKYFIDIKYQSYFIINLLTLFFNSFSIIPFTLLRIKNQIFKFSVVSLINFILTTIISIILLLYFKFGVLSIFIAKFIVELIVFFYWIFFLKNELIPNLNYKINLPELKYSLPNIFNSIVNAFSSTLDRLLLKNKVDLGSLGLYQLSKNFSSILTIFAQSLKSNYFPFLYENVNKKEFKNTILPKYELVYFFSLSIIALSFSLFFTDLIRFINRPKYFSVAEYIPFFILGYLFHYAEAFLARGTDLNKKTHFDLVFNIVNLFLVSIVSWFLINKYGLQGAMYSFLIINICVSSLKIILSHLIYKRPFLLKKFLLLILIFFLFFSYNFYFKIENIYISIFVKFIITIFYSITVFLILIGKNAFRNFITYFFNKLLNLNYEKNIT
jgi:O-antigen/teichoic acid export membrane protein